MSYAGQPQQYGELWLPEGIGPFPVVVFVHGGCWLNAFDITHTHAASTALAQAGYAVWSLEYRRVGDPGGGWPGTFDDISLGVFGRLSPQHKRRPWHRFQHLYLWFLYGLQTLKWHLIDDFVVLAKGKMGNLPVPRPRGKEMVGFWLGKAAFFSWALVLPLFFHTWWHVLLVGTIASMSLGFVLSVVFQLAHVVVS